MKSIAVRNFETPDEVRTPDKTKVHVVDLTTARAGRMTAQPGWSWEKCIKPVVGGDSCQVHHVGVATAGRMHVVHNDGSEADIGPGDAFVIEPGHNAWVVGDEPWVSYEFDTKAAETYARPT